MFFNFHLFSIREEEKKLENLTQHNLYIKLKLIIYKQSKSIQNWKFWNLHGFCKILCIKLYKLRIKRLVCLRVVHGSSTLYKKQIYRGLKWKWDPWTNLKTNSSMAFVKKILSYLLLTSSRTNLKTNSSMAFVKKILSYLLLTSFRPA